jgi:hypothetical protein
MSQAAIVHIIDDDESQRETLVSLLGSVDFKDAPIPPLPHSSPPSCRTLPVA